MFEGLSGITYRAVVVFEGRIRAPFERFAPLLVGSCSEGGGIEVLGPGELTAVGAEESLGNAR